MEILFFRQCKYGLIHWRYCDCEMYKIHDLVIGKKYTSDSYRSDQKLIKLLKKATKVTKKQ